MGFDVAGIVFKWRMFDHFVSRNRATSRIDIDTDKMYIKAHLAGASLGLGYMYYGEKHIWEPLISKIHQVRENSGRGNRGGEGGNFMWTEPRQQPKSDNRWTGWFSR